jgi:hypothetical protein
VCVRGGVSILKKILPFAAAQIWPCATMTVYIYIYIYARNPAIGPECRLRFSYHCFKIFTADGRRYNLGVSKIMIQRAYLRKAPFLRRAQTSEILGLFHVSHRRPALWKLKVARAPVQMIHPYPVEVGVGRGPGPSKPTFLTRFPKPGNVKLIEKGWNSLRNYYYRKTRFSSA